MDFKIGEIDFNSDQTVIIAEAGVNHLGRMDYAEELQNELFKIQDETPEPELVAASIDG